MSVFAQRMHGAYMTTWKWYRRGLMRGSNREENGIRGPENLLPSKIDDAVEVMNLTAYACRKGTVYHQTRTKFMEGKIPNSFRSPGGYLMGMIFEQEITRE